MIDPVEHEGDHQDCWGAAEAECDLCGRTWVAVYPMCCERIECPNEKCGHMTRAPHLVEPLPDDEREVWQQ